MNDENRSKDQLLEEILQEAHSLRESKKETGEIAKSEPVKEPVPESAPQREPASSPAPVQEPPARRRSIRNGGLRRLFQRNRRRYEEYDEEQDIYYGMQLKPIEEYQKEFGDTEESEPASQTENRPTEQYSFLFDNTPEDELDEEIATRFRELHEERHRRVKEALESEGLDFHQVVSEYGEIRPLPKKTGIDHGQEIFSVSPGKQPEPVVIEAPVSKPEPEEKPLPQKENSPLEVPAPTAQAPAAEPQHHEEPSPVQPETPARIKVLPVSDPEYTVDAILEQVRQKNLRKASIAKPPIEDSTFEPEAVLQPEKETPIEEEAPAEPEVIAVEEAPSEPEATAEEEVPAEPEVNAEEEAPAESEASAVEETSAEPEATVEEEPPAEPEATAEEEAPAEPAANTEEQTSVESKDDAKEESPAKPAEKSAVKSAASSIKKKLYSIPISVKSKPDIHISHNAEAPGSGNPFVDETPRQPKMPRESREGPSYAPHLKPVHLMDLDVLDFALREESKFYAEQARKEMEAEAARRKKKNRKLKTQKAIQKGFALNGEEPENDPNEEPAAAQEVLEDFNTPSDAPSVSHDLKTGMRELLLRVMFTGLCTVLLGVFGLVGEFHSLFSWAGEIPPTVYMILNLVFLLLCMAVCFRMLWHGIKSLFTFKANSDSGLSLAVFAVLVQSIYACFFPNQIMSGSLHLYSVLAAGGLFLNSLGKLVMSRRIWNNFRFVASRESKYAVQLYDDYNTSLKLAKDCVIDSPVIAYQHKTGFLSRFLQYSYEPDPLETNSQTLAPIGLIASLALCIACLVLSQSAAEAISAFAACACICVPFTSMLAGNLLLGKLAALGKKCGAMAVGYPAVEKFSSVNAVMMDAQELYPKGTIILNGIKTFGNQRIDEAILEATALMCAAGGPLVSVFDQIIKTRREILPRVDKPVYEDGRGVTGWVSGHRVLVGNRDLLAAHQIDPPSHDFENRHTTNGRKAVYLAVGGQLVALFLLTYRSDSHRARELQRMETNGISMILRTCDPNITAQSVASSFGLDPHSVRILPDTLGQELVRVTSNTTKTAGAMLATKGRTASMCRILSGCVRTRSNLTLAVVMQTVAVILGFVLVAFLACYSGLQQLSTLTLLLYEAFWSFAILFFPRLHKP